MRFDEILGLLPRMSYKVDDGTGLRLFELELLFWAAIILLTVLLVRLRPAVMEKAEAGIYRISQHTRFWLFGFALIALAVRLALLSLIPVPTPSVHDESSYILAADTYAHGRLTNPPSAMWQHFESFHINVLPTYQSMYPPAQGAALAIGQLLTKVPWVGVLLSTALMCSAIYWMLLGWLPAPWAWLGGAFACLRYGVFSYWINTYFGGSVGAIGGALVLGALPRLREKPTARMGLVLAAGLLILANSRPLEGFLFSLPILISVVVILIEKGKEAWRESLRVALPAMVLLAAGGAWMLFYNWRGTGNPLVMPYMINLSTYHISKPYFFQTPNPVPNYRHQSMRALYVYHEFPDILMSKYELGALVLKRISVYYSFFLWPFLLLVGPCLIAVWRSQLRIVLYSFALLITSLLAQMWDPRPHYAAPAAGAVILVLLFSLRYLRNSESDYALWGSRAIAIVFAVWMISPIAERLRDPFMIDPVLTKMDISGARVLDKDVYSIPREFERGRIESGLLARGGKHLVIVHYPLHDMPDDEWVYNAADIDGASIVWARDMGASKNKELLNYYHDRQIWYVDHSAFLVRLVPYDQIPAPLELRADGLPSDAGFPPISGALQGLISNANVTATQAKPQLFAAVSR